MEPVINIERNRDYLTIEELEHVKQLIDDYSGSSILINKKLLSDILENSIDDYWTIKVSGEYE